MNFKIFVLFAAITLTGCSTLNDSLQLGGAVGAATGATATFAGFESAGRAPSLGAVALGAAAGSAVGLISSYLIHKQVAQDRTNVETEQTEMHFGDLPPSPFVVPRKNKQGDY